MQLETGDKRLFDFTLPTLVVGMGSSGMSCARYLAKKQCPFAIADSRSEPPQLEEITKMFPGIKVFTGDFEPSIFENYSQIVVSPGVSIRTPLFKALQMQGTLLLGDIELFAQAVDKPVIAITGSNGKSTVTTLVEKMALECGIKAIAGGNLGIPALDLLKTNSDLYILELSSFQLETTYSLKTLSATVLNVSEDHMDRYDDLEDYRKVKEKILQNTQYAVINREEQLANVEQLKNKVITSFGSDVPGDNEYGLVPVDHAYQLNKGDHTIVISDEIKLKGLFNFVNILAALALLQPLQLNEQQLVRAITDYKGLPHRCEWVDTISGVEFYNDSKGTNIGATIAAINAFEMDGMYGMYGNERKTILIAGGEGKGADFTALAEVIKTKIKATVLIGADAETIKTCAVNSGTKTDDLYTVDSMENAVLMANRLAKNGDVVLFSPACASFDMYKNYMERGEDFKEKVLALKLLIAKGELKDVS